MLKNEELVVKNLDLISKIARKIKNRYLSMLEFDDLVGYGVFGLIDAAARYDASRGKTFRDYACKRVRGSIFDGLRNNGLNIRANRTKNEYGEYEYNLPIYFADIYKELGNNFEDDIIRHEELYPDSNWDTPFNQVEYQLDYKRLNDNLNKLPDKEHSVVYKYYYQNIPLKKIGLEHGITEGRTCQILKAGLNKLRMQYGLPPIYKDSKYTKNS